MAKTKKLPPATGSDTTKMLRIGSRVLNLYQDIEDALAELDPSMSWFKRDPQWQRIKEANALIGQAIVKILPG